MPETCPKISASGRAAIACAFPIRNGSPKISSALSKRQQGQDKEVKELAWRMQNRLHKRYVKLKARGKREQKAIAALARELCAFNHPHRQQY